MAVKNKTVAKPKPSTLLKKTLALLGNKGQRWIKGKEKIKPGTHYDSPLNPSDEPVIFVKGAYCSIGAIKAVNTPRSREAAIYLAKAIDSDFHIDYLGEAITNKADLYDAAENTIINYNDYNTTFYQLRKKFEKARKLALKEGN